MAPAALFARITSEPVTQPAATATRSRRGGGRHTSAAQRRLTAVLVHEIKTSASLQILGHAHTDGSVGEMICARTLQRIFPVRRCRSAAALQAGRQSWRRHGRAVAASAAVNEPVNDQSGRRACLLGAWLVSGVSGQTQQAVVQMPYIREHLRNSCANPGQPPVIGHDTCFVPHAVQQK